MSKGARYIAGIHSVRTALKHGADRLQAIWYDARRNDRRLGQLLSEARKSGVSLQATDRSELDRLAGSTRHQGVVARADMPAALGRMPSIRCFRSCRSRRFCWSSTVCRIRTTWEPVCVPRMQPACMP